MCKKAALIFSILSLTLLLGSCKGEEPAPVVPATPPPAPVPVAEPVPEPVDTATETEPVLPPAEEPAASTSGAGSITKGSLVGNYKCGVTSDQFPLGMTPPPATCKIYEGSGDELKIGPVGSTGINGTIKIVNGKSLKVSGSFNVGIGELKMNASLTKRNAKTYKGNGTGSFGDVGTIKYTLTLKKM